MLTRRECLALAPATLVAADGGLVLENKFIRYQSRPGLRRFENKVANTAAILPETEFELEFGDGLVVRATDCERKQSAGQLLFRHKSGVEVRVRFELPGAYLRKRIGVRNAGGRRLMRADLEDWSGVKRQWQSMTADRMKTGSHPIYCDNVWAGVEFVAAFNRYSAEGFVLRSRPGGTRVDKDWVELHSTVIGASEPGQVRDAFLRYIEDIRISKPRWVACYNSWWTLPLRPSHAELIGLAERLVRDFHGNHGVFFDLFAVDEGWSNPLSVWEIDPKSLPDGFRDLRKTVAGAGGNIGLWISPSANYPRSTSYDWAKSKGLVVVPADKPRGVSLADPGYRLPMLAALRKLVVESGFAHVKFDGFTAREEVAHHDLLPGDDSVEPLAAHALELLDAAKRANPKLVSEPTCLNSLVNYISPWIVRHADSVWGNSGGDCPRCVSPAPDYREAATTAREYYIFSSMDEIWLPQNVLQYFDIVHCDDSKGFANHAAMAIGRGRFFLPVYLNPKFMESDDWRVFAGLVRWARANQAILANTEVLRSKVELGEPYCYAHWQPERGILVLRNPGNENKPYTITLPWKDAVVYSQYPYRKGMAVDAGRVTVDLAPCETLYLEATPRTRLRETVVLNARWWPGAVAPDAGLKQLRVIEPGGKERTLDVTPRAAAASTCAVDSVCVRGKSFELACTVNSSVPATVLLLVQFPGLKHFDNECTATVNGAAATLDTRHSKGHIGMGFSKPNTYWSAVSAYETEWTFYLCPVTAGASKLHFRGSCAVDKFRVGLWLWSDADLAAHRQTVPLPASQPEMPQWRDTLERRGVCVLKTS